MSRLSRTRIEWCDYSINPVKGLCPVACPYCYARTMYHRYKWNPVIRFEWAVANHLGKMKPGSKVFWGSTMELFGPWIDPEWRRLILAAPTWATGLTHIFLTKLPQNLPREWPDNCWVGTSITHDGIGERNYGCTGAIPSLEDVNAKVKFISFEPLLSPVEFKRYVGFVDWVIIGAQTPYNKKTAPKKEWIDEIVDAADIGHIPVFLKDNLRPILKSVYGNLPMRQEYPEAL